MLKYGGFLKKGICMKYRLSIHLLIFISMTLIILGQSLQDWGEFSLIRRWTTGIFIAVWLVNLFVFFTPSYKSTKKNMYNS